MISTLVHWLQWLTAKLQREILIRAFARQSARHSTQADQPPERICVHAKIHQLRCQRRHNFRRGDALVASRNSAKLAAAASPQNLHTCIFFPPTALAKCAHSMPKDEPPAAPMPASDSHAWEPNIFHTPVLNPRAQAAACLMGEKRQDLFSPWRMGGAFF
jgi:hypothetical protein